MSTARSGLLASVSRLNAAASNIAKAGTPATPISQALPTAGRAEGPVAALNVDLAHEAVDVLAASLAFRANVAVLQAVDGMVKRTLDMSA